MPALYLIATLVALIPAIAMAGDCRIEHRQGSWLSYLEDCPKDISDIVLRHSVCLYALNTYKDIRTPTHIKEDTQEVMEDRRCNELPCDKKEIFALYADKPEILGLANEAYQQMKDIYYAERNGSTFDVACASE